MAYHPTKKSNDGPKAKRKTINHEIDKLSARTILSEHTDNPDEILSTKEYINALYTFDNGNRLFADRRGFFVIEEVIWE